MKVVALVVLYTIVYYEAGGTGCTIHYYEAGGTGCAIHYSLL